MKRSQKNLVTPEDTEKTMPTFSRTFVTSSDFEFPDRGRFPNYLILNSFAKEFRGITGPDPRKLEVQQSFEFYSKLDVI